jgi:VacB/RNase II family 3'-5' exoribonuclease
MKTIIDRQGALKSGLADIRVQFEVPDSFPADVLAQAAATSRRPLTGRADWTERDFATLDPQSSTDLDQAFAIELAGSDLLLHYAIADVSFFVDKDDPIDREAWARGTTIYLPDGKASLYPPALSEGAASLLPNVDRPAVVFTVRVDPGGQSSLDGAVRAVIRSRAKLGYESVTSEQLPAGFADLSRRIEQAEDARGAERIEAPEQELVEDSAGGYTLRFRAQQQAEKQNAAMSLAANLAIADALLAHRTGLFRVMAEPDARAVQRLRHSAKALGLAWPRDATLAQFERTLDSVNPRHIAFRSAVRRAGPRASYAPYREGVVPWHSAMAATYAHATAPLRRLADRYVIEAALQIAAGQTVSAELGAIFELLPPVMERAEARAAQIDRATLDLAEAVMLEGSEGTRFDAVVTDIDERGARIQLADPAVISRVDPKGAEPGDSIGVKLTKVDVPTRQIAFERID